MPPTVTVLPVELVLVAVRSRASVSPVAEVVCSTIELWIGKLKVKWPVEPTLFAVSIEEGMPESFNKVT